MDMTFRPSGATPFTYSEIPVTKTFADAAASYIEHGGEARYLAPIIAYFGDRPLRSIYPFDVKMMTETLYPDRRGTTKNRQAITPTRAVMIHGYERGWCDRISIRRYREEKPRRRKPATPVWLHVFARQCDEDGLQHLAALVLFMATTAARVSEAIALRWQEVDISARTALLVKTKTSTNSLRHLTDAITRRLRTMEQSTEPSDRVFGYTCRHSVNERIKAVCLRAGIPYKPPHTCGRHTFANMAMDMGMDITTAMKAGGWESTTVFLETYVRPKANAGRIVADRFSLTDFGEM